MGSSTPATTTTINKTELPPYIEQGGEANLAFGNQVADNLAQPYTGNMVANPNNSDTNAAYQAVRDSANLAQPGMTTAANTLASVQNYQAPTVGAQTWGNLSSADQSKYLSPYTQNVVDTTLATMDKARQQALQQNADAATAAGAWGGSRSGVMQGVTNANSIMNQAQTAAQLYNQGYQNAQGTFATDADRALTADRSNQTASIQGAQVQSQAAMQGGYTAQLAQNAAMQGAAGLQAIGQNQTQYQQDLLNQQASQYDAMRDYPLEQLGIRESALSATPYATTTTSQSTSSGGSNSGIGSIFGGIGSIASSLMPLMMFSDERMKKNKDSLGIADAHTGVPLYSYHYKDEPNSAPKHVGPMAQDLEKAGRGVATAPNGMKMIAAQDAVTPTVAAIAAASGAKVARPSSVGFTGSGGGGLLDDGPAPKVALDVSSKASTADIQKAANLAKKVLPKAKAMSKKVAA